MNKQILNNEFDSGGISAGEMMIALSEAYPETSYGAVPVVDQYDALEVYRAFDDGALAELPGAYAAYVDHQQQFVS